MSKSYFLISAPDSGNEEVLKTQTSKTESLAKNTKFSIPDLRVGTLDVLMSLSDDLAKFDSHVESVVRKIARQLHELSDSNEANNRMFSVNDANVEHYLGRFHWDDARYGKNKPLRELVETITQSITRMEEDLRIKSSEYNSLTQTIAASDRKAAGNLTIRSLDDILRNKKDSIVSTEYLTTLLIVINKYVLKDWWSTYESLHEYVVPRSSTILAEDNDFALVNVVVFKKFQEDFKNKVREKRYIIREYNLNPEGRTEAEDRNKMEQEKEHQRKRLLLWCKTNFSEAFVAWIHMKAIRVFVESVLRYGLPPKFTAILVEPIKASHEKKLFDTLNNLYKHLASPHLQFNDQEESGEKFYPFVYVPLPVDFLSKN